MRSNSGGSRYVQGGPPARNTRQLLTPQAQAFKEKFRNEFEAYKRSQQMHREFNLMRIRQQNSSRNRSQNSSEQSSSDSEDDDYAHKLRQKATRTGAQQARFSNSGQPQRGSGVSWRGNLPSIVDPFGLMPVNKSMQGQNMAPQGSPRKTRVSMLIDSPYLSPAEKIVRRNSRFASTQATKKRKSFAMKVIKEHNFDSEKAKKKQQENKEKEKREREAREVACHILMDHGVSAAQANSVARRASKIQKMAVSEVAANKVMQAQWRDELLQYRKRLAVMEQAEMARQATELVTKEEKMANHGKKYGYFKAPQLSTMKRKQRMRPLDTFMLEAEKYKPKVEKVDPEKKELERAQKRGSKYVIEDIAEHHRQKNLIKARMIELASLLAQEDTVKQDIDKMFYMDNKLPAPLRRQSLLQQSPGSASVVSPSGHINIPKTHPDAKKYKHIKGVWNY